MTLYDDLRVSSDASTEEIRAAWRAIAKMAHPDVGGDADVYRRASFAHEVLTDPERRARYDADNSDVEPESSIKARVDQLVMEKISNVLSKVFVSRRLSFDIRHHLMLSFVRDRSELQNMIEARRAHLESLRAALKRARGRLLILSINSSISSLEEEIAMGQRNIRLCDLAIQEAETCELTSEPEVTGKITAEWKP